MSPSDPRHGTYAGALAHWRDGEKVCAECGSAATRYMKRRRLAIQNGEPLSIPRLGSQRRIQALMTLGWTHADIARACGLADRKSVRRILCGGERGVYRKTASAIAAAYDAMSMAVPEMTSVRSRAKNMALRAGYAPPLAWNDIDDPNERPDLGVIQHIHRGRPIAHTLEDYDFLISCGESKEQALARLGVTGEAIEVARRRAKERAA